MYKYISTDILSRLPILITNLPILLHDCWEKLQLY